MVPVLQNHLSPSNPNLKHTLTSFAVIEHEIDIADMFNGCFCCSVRIDRGGVGLDASEEDASSLLERVLTKEPDFIESDGTDHSEEPIVVGLLDPWIDSREIKQGLVEGAEKVFKVTARCSLLPEVAESASKPLLGFPGPPLALPTPTAPAVVENLLLCGSSFFSNEVGDASDCRICGSGQVEKSDPLIAPCDCVGGLNLVHKMCLQRWTEERPKQRLRANFLVGDGGGQPHSNNGSQTFNLEHMPAFIVKGEGSDHVQDETVSSICVESENPIVIGLLERSIDSMWTALGESLFRYKGVLDVKGCEKKYVFEGVHKIFRGKFTTKWKKNDVRKSKFVFIGCNLPGAKLEKDFLALAATELRFAVGTKVMANVDHKFRLGTVIRHWDEGNAYRIRLVAGIELVGGGREVWAPVDEDCYIKAPTLENEFLALAATELRFAVGTKVMANVGHKFRLGTVVRHWDEGNAYRIRIGNGGREVWAHTDEDCYIKAKK